MASRKDYVMSKIGMSLKSIRTTVLGICGGLIAIIPQIVALIDGDPATGFSWTAFVGGLAIMGVGVAAKDGDKSTEDVK